MMIYIDILFVLSVQGTHLSSKYRVLTVKHGLKTNVFYLSPETFLSSSHANKCIARTDSVKTCIASFTIHVRQKTDEGGTSCLPRQE